MGLRIQNNIAAMNAHRNLGIADSAMGKSLERLSSGYRINRAADDAAGLAISQSFRADIASFKVASRNTSEASSLLQVAEGGLDQIGNMLTRMKELATQAASANSGTNIDRINDEYSQLKLEIDRIANSTEYADSALLNGTFGASLTGALGDATVDMGIIDDNVQWKVTGDLATQDDTVTAFGTDAAEGTYTIARNAAANSITISNGTVTESATLGAADTDVDITFANLGLTITNASGMTANEMVGDTVVIEKTGLTNLNVSGASAGTYTITDAADATMQIGNGTITETVSGLQTGVSQNVNFAQLGISFTLTADYDANNVLNGTEITVTSGGTGSTFQIGAENNADNQIEFSLASVNTDDIGTDSATTGATAANLYATDLSSAANAQDAMLVIDDAIGDVAELRGDIGANMNRLSYAAANLASTIENVQAAESVIRDVDMASEMTSFTKNQILLQAGTAMLAQANMAPQQVLALFG